MPNRHIAIPALEDEPLPRLLAAETFEDEDFEVYKTTGRRGPSRS